MSRKSKKKKIVQLITSLIIIIVVTICGYLSQNGTNIEKLNSQKNVVTSVQQENVIDLATIPEYTTNSYIELNNNIPNFEQEDYTTEPFEEYSNLDTLGRCGVAYANICKETMPKENEEREEISSIIPTGWEQKKYYGEYLYNRCHLIGWQLSAENTNEKNLITGTRYMNTEGMLPFENKIADYIQVNRNNHILYRVTPIFEGDNKVASGVQMEAWSVEDNGEGICFNIYCYNVQPGIIIDYKTGESYEK